MADTRKDKRAPVSLKVRFKSATVDEFVEQYSRDLSRGGVFIKSKNPMAVGTLLKFEFQLKDESRLIHGVGRVVWKRDSEQADESNPPGMGIKFIKMDPESRQTVQTIVDKRESDSSSFEGDRAPAEAPQGGEQAEGFFPKGPSEQELPVPEDRTSVRHASEFLASALADADDTAAAEARAGAEAARRRTEEIERERAQQQPKTRSSQPPKPQRASSAREVDEDAPTGTKPKVAPAVDEDAPTGTKPKVTPAADEDASTGTKPKVAPAAGDAGAKDEEQEADPAATTRPEGMPTGATAAATSGNGEAAPGSAERSGGADGAAADMGGEAVDPFAPTEIGDRPNSDAKPSAAVSEDAVTQAKPTEGAKPSGPSAAQESKAQPSAPSTPASEESRSRAMPILLGVAALAVIGYVLFQQFGGSGEEQPRASAGNEPIEQPADEGSPDDEPSSAAAAEPAVDESDEATDTASDETVGVQVQSSPSGAKLFVDGRAQGSAPTELQLPADGPATVEARLAGHTPVSQKVNASAREDQPLELELEPMSYVLEVSTRPAGARVKVGDETLATPGELELEPVREPVRVIAMKPGYRPARKTVKADAFSERDGAMRASVSFGLRRRPRGGGGGGQTSPSGGEGSTEKQESEPEPQPESGQKSGSTEEAPQQEPSGDDEPTKEPASEPAPSGGEDDDDVPENPF